MYVCMYVCWYADITIILQLQDKVLIGVKVESTMSTHELLNTLHKPPRLHFICRHDARVSRSDTWNLLWTWNHLSASAIWNLTAWTSHYAPLDLLVDSSSSHIHHQSAWRHEFRNPCCPPARLRQPGAHTTAYPLTISRADHAQTSISVFSPLTLREPIRPIPAAYWRPQ